MTCIKVGVAGTHSTGKSTFLDLLKERLQSAGLAVGMVADLGVEARNAGFPILRNHTFASTAWIVTRGISLELQAALKADVVLVDRPVVDALGYLRAALEYRGEAIGEDAWTYLRTLVSLHSATYERLFLSIPDPSIPIDRSKDRDLDPDFRALAAKGVEQEFEILGLPYVCLPAKGREQIAVTISDEIIQRLRVGQ